MSTATSSQKCFVFPLVFLLLHSGENLTMAKNKTTETQASVAEYLAAITNDKRREDCAALVKLITTCTGYEPKMWGTSIVGFGSYNYTYDSGHSGSSALVGFSSRANAITLYVSGGEEREALLAKFGKHKTGKGCVYIQKIEDIDTDVLVTLVKNTVEETLKRFPNQS